MKSRTKYCLAGLIVLLEISNTSAQRPTITWSEDFKEEKGELLGKRIHYRNDTLFMYARKITKKVVGDNLITPSIIAFDNKMNVVARNSYGSDREDLVYEGMYALGDGFIMFGNFSKKKDKEKTLYAQKIDASLNPVGGTVELWTITGEKPDDVVFGNIVSDDLSKFMIYEMPDEGKDDKQRFIYKMFDANLNAVSGNTITLESHGISTLLRNFIVTNGGEIFLIQHVYNTPKRTYAREVDGKSVPDYKVNVVHIDTKGQINTIEVPLENHFLINSSLMMDKNGDALFVGLTSVNEHENITGIMNLRVDKSGKNIISTGKYEFAPEFISRVNTLDDYKTSKKKFGIYDGYNMEILFDGGKTFFVMENKRSEAQYKSNGEYWYTKYFSKGIIATRFDNSTGKYDWSTFIPKNQALSQVSTYLYHWAAVRDHKLYLYYNEDEKNLAYDINSNEEPRQAKDYKKNIYLMSVEIDESGNAKRSEVTNTSKCNCMTYIYGSGELSDNKYLLYHYDVQEDVNKLGLLKFE
jgi:hypothetical protein